MNDNENSLSGKLFFHGKVLYKLIRSLYCGEVVGAIPVEDKILVIDKMNISYFVFIFVDNHAIVHYEIFARGRTSRVS